MSTETLDSAADEAGDAFTVTVHLRGGPTAAGARRQQSVLDRLREFADDGTVPELRVERWSAKVNVPTSAAAEADANAVALFEEFTAAAEAAGARLEPFFERRTAAGGLLSAGPPTAEVIVFPVVCTTVRRDEDLVGLYPCWKDGVHHSVEDCLDAIAAGEGVENL